MIVKDHNGIKLSKQTGAEPISDTEPAANIRSALTLLNQKPPPSNCQTVSDLLAWAITHWNRALAKL